MGLECFIFHRIVIKYSNCNMIRIQYNTFSIDFWGTRQYSLTGLQTDECSNYVSFEIQYIRTANKYKDSDEQSKCQRAKYHISNKIEDIIF